MQAPGGPTEDTSGGFKYGGWTVPFWDDFLDNVMTTQMEAPFDLLLGRKTYEIFAGYWPTSKEAGADKLNSAKKYVVSTTLKDPEWKNSTVISGDIVKQIQALKEQTGPELQVHGSANLIQTLLQYDLVDELRLKIFPLALGLGKRLFGDGTVPASFKLSECKSSPKGVIVSNYVRTGEVKTGSF
jgi:dihydrofolate reductase